MPKKLKTFEAQIEERNGEQEYTYNYIVYAPSLKSAELMADETAKRWYGWEDDDTEPEKYDNYYEFFGGSLVARVNYVRETTEKEFIESMLRRYSIGLRPEVVAA